MHIYGTKWRFYEVFLNEVEEITDTLMCIRDSSYSSYEIMSLFEKLYNDGNTIVLVTHEPDIAAFGHRIVKLRDGKIISDQANLNIANAEYFLKNYQEI